MLAQQVVEHPQKLQHSLLSSGISKARVVDDKVGVDLAVVPANVESSGEKYVMSYHLCTTGGKDWETNLLYLAAAPCLETISTLGMKR